jgi:hypothetical protein
MAQRISAINCTQATPAGLPSGIPGIGLVIEGAIQQAPQSGRQFMTILQGKEGKPNNRQARIVTLIANRPVRRPPPWESAAQHILI